MISFSSLKKNNAEKSILPFYLYLPFYFLFFLHTRIKVDPITQFTDIGQLALKIIIDSNGLIPPRYKDDVITALTNLKQKQSELKSNGELCLHSFSLPYPYKFPI